MSDSEENEEVAIQVKASKKNMKRKQVLKEKKNGAGSPGVPSQKKNKNNPKKAPSPKESEESTPEVEAKESSSDEDVPEPKKNAPLDTVADLGKNVHVRVNEFKGNVFVDIREYYIHKDSGELKPGKKGMSMTPKMWADLKKSIPLIDKKVATLT